MIKKFTRADGSTMELHDMPPGDSDLVQVVVTNPVTYTGSGGVADILLTREQVTALTLTLVDLLGRDQ